MSWQKDRRGDRGYHHGNLKEALLQAALGLIAEKGPAGFTFADAARTAGVSAAAPYRHYRDRDELISDVARQGFEKFAQQKYTFGRTTWSLSQLGSQNLKKSFGHLVIAAFVDSLCHLGQTI